MFEKIGTLAVAAGLTAIALAPATARADSTMGTLVYNFTYSANQNISSRDSANPAENMSGSTPGELAGGTANSGISHYNGSLNDKGTMTVEIIKKQPDGALVVMISEQGQNVRRASPAECVVYGNTNVICDPNKTVYSEEYTLLRFLANNFVDPTQTQTGGHWQIVQDVNNDHVTADYAINGDTNGMMQIGEKRTVKELGAGHLTTNIETKIGYDYTRTVPMSVDEYAQQYTDAGINGSQKSIYQTTLQLVSDSMAKT